MTETPIYQSVREKLRKHGVDRNWDGLVTLNDRRLFLLFVKLERAKRQASFAGVLRVSEAIETYLAYLGKPQIIAFVYMYLMFSELGVRRRELDEVLSDGKVRSASIFDRSLSDEEKLIGFWADVKFKKFGQHYLRIIYRSEIESSRDA